MFEIDWTTEEDRMHRHRKASTIHGWLRMWRGTLAGNERVRQQGRREMKEARAWRRYRSKHPQAGGGSSSSPFSFLLGGFGNRRKPAVAAPAAKPHISSSPRHHHRSGSQSQHAQRPAPAQRKSSPGANTGHHTTRQGRASAKPEPKRHRSSHSSKSKPRVSRQSSGRR